MMRLTDLDGKQNRVARLLMLVAAYFLTGLLPAAAAILIWPTNVFIDSKEKAAAMWLENRGNTLQTYQMRVYSWSHTGGKEELTEQNDIVGSPPIMQIEPGKRQLVLLRRVKS